MPDDSPVVDHASDGPTAVIPSAKRPWQIGLRTLALLLAVIAAWLTYFINRHRIALLEERIVAIRPMAHELTIDDPGQIAVVKAEEHWMDDDRWQLYLPEGRYKLCVATRGIADRVIPLAKGSTALAGGRHQLRLDQRQTGEGWRVVVDCDGSDAILVEESKEWNPVAGSMGGGYYPTCQQFAPERPVILYHRRFMKRDKNGSSSTPSGPSEGVMMWIEPLGGHTPKSPR